MHKLSRLRPVSRHLLRTLRTTQSSFFGAWTRYAQSKLANILYAQELARRYPKIITMSISPGLIFTGLAGNLSLVNKAFVYGTSYFNSVPEAEGIKNGLWAAMAGKAEVASGEFYEPVVKVRRTTKASEDRALANEL